MSPVKATDHDTFGYRLIRILKKLNQGDKLDPKALAEEFNVNLRAIQRDLNERFARLDGVIGLFSSGTDNFLSELFDARVQTALLLKGPHYEDLNHL